jgi:hypothetical protein
VIGAPGNPVNRACNDQASTSVSSAGADIGPVEAEKTMRSVILAVMSLAVASLGLGTYLAAVDVAWNSPSVGPSAFAGYAYAARDETGRPICRRNNFGDPQRPLIRIGYNCRSI